MVWIDIPVSILGARNHPTAHNHAGYPNPLRLHSEESTETAIMTSKMVVQQPQPYNHATVTSNQWSSEICDCTQDMAQCCFAFWCFPCFACKTSKDAGECLCLPLLDWFGAIPPATLAMRVSLRQRYGIEGTICNDCVYSFFCTPCAWCQMSREMKTRGQPVTIVNIRPR